MRRMRASRSDKSCDRDRYASRSRTSRSQDQFSRRWKARANQLRARRDVGLGFRRRLFDGVARDGRRFGGRCVFRRPIATRQFSLENAQTEMVGQRTSRAAAGRQHAELLIPKSLRVHG